MVHLCFKWTKRVAALSGPHNSCQASEIILSEVFPVQINCKNQSTARYWFKALNILTCVLKLVVCQQICYHLHEAQCLMCLLAIPIYTNYRSQSKFKTNLFCIQALPLIRWLYLLHFFPVKISYMNGQSTLNAMIIWHRRSWLWHLQPVYWIIKFKLSHNS